MDAPPILTTRPMVWTGKHARGGFLGRHRVGGGYTCGREVREFQVTMHPGGAARGSQSEGRAESTEPEPSHVGDPCAQGPDQPQLKVMKAFLTSPREKEHRSRWGAGRPKPGRPGLSPACELGRRSGLKELGARAPGWLAALRGPCLCVKHTAFGQGPRRT